MLEDAIRRKIENLVARRAGLTRDLRANTDVARCQSWIAEALNVIEMAIPIENAYRRRIVQIAEGGNALNVKVGSIGERLRAFVPDIDAGLIAGFGNRIRAETFDDFLDHAEAYRQEGEHQAAGVLAGVVF